MKLSSIRNAVTSRAGRQILKVSKHSPVLLFAAGVVGVVATVVLASKATLKLDEILQEHEEKLDVAEGLRAKEMEQYTEQDYQKDLLTQYIKTTGAVARLYGPAFLTGVVSVAALTGSHVILSRRNVALTAAYAALDRGYREYRKRVVEQMGPERDRQFTADHVSKEIVEETDQGPKTRKIKVLANKNTSIYARFFDESCPAWSPVPFNNQMYIQCQQNFMNNLLQARGHVFLNEVYDALQLPRSKEGAVVGWVKGNGDDYIDFGVFQGDTYMGQEFVNGNERSVRLDFNVDGVIYDKI